MADKTSISAQGCYVDDAETRDLPTQMLLGVNVTIEACIYACASASYKYAAVQVSRHLSSQQNTLSISMVISRVDIDMYVIRGLVHLCRLSVYLSHPLIISKTKPSWAMVTVNKHKTSMRVLSDAPIFDDQYYMSDLLTLPEHTIDKDAQRARLENETA